MADVALFGLAAEVTLRGAKADRVIWKRCVSMKPLTLQRMLMYVAFNPKTDEDQRDTPGYAMCSLVSEKCTVPRFLSSLHYVFRCAVASL